MQKKLKLLQQLKPREIDDLIPLLEMDYDQLAAVAARATKERSTLANSNRIYYLSNKLKVCMPWVNASEGILIDRFVYL